MCLKLISMEGRRRGRRSDWGPNPWNLFDIGFDKKPILQQRFWLLADVLIDLVSEKKRLWMSLTSMWEILSKGHIVHESFCPRFGNAPHLRWFRENLRPNAKEWSLPCCLVIPDSVVLVHTFVPASTTHTIDDVSCSSNSIEAEIRR
jgi:hypothetical protein